MEERRALLIVRDGRMLTVILDAPSMGLGAIIRNDSRLSPPCRVFRFVGLESVVGIPMFEEVDHAYLGMSDGIRVEDLYRGELIE